MHRLLSVLAGLFCVLWAVVSPAAAAAPGASGKGTAPAATSLRIRYSVTLIGLPIGTATVSGTLNPSSYRLEGTGKLTGLAGVIVNSKGAATAAGGFADGHVDPASFAATAATSNYVLTIRMALAKGNATGVEITPVYEQRPDRVPLTDADRRGIIDPLSSFLMAVPGSGDPVGPDACNRTLRLFDGGVRFDIVLTFTGIRQVKAPGYSGPVAVCAARYKPWAGHRPERPATKFMMNNKEMEVWLAPLGGTRYVFPFRISVLSMIGTTVVEATDMDFGPGTRAAAAPR